MGALLFTVLLTSLLSLAVLGGGVYAWSTCIVAVISSAVCLYLSRRNTGPFPPLAPLFAALLLFLVITALPMPLALTRITGSARYEQNRVVTQFLAKATDLGLMDKRMAFFSLSRNRAGTLRIIVLAVAAFSMGSIAAALPQAYKRPYVRFLVALGAAVGVLGYIGQWRVPQGDTFWWVFPLRHADPGPVACFMNRNHYGGFLAVLAPVALSLFVGDLRNRRVWAALSSIGAFALISLAVLFSLSRGAVVAYAAGMIATPFLLMRRRRFLAGLLMLVIAGGVAAGILFSARDMVKDRLRSLANPTQEFDVRIDAWKTGLRVWKAYPIAGAGPNAFRMVFPQHRTSSRRTYMTHVENEYIQTLAETGLIGVCLTLCLGFALLKPLVRPSGTSPPPEDVCNAVEGAVVVVLVHASFDFPLHLPLYAALVFSIVGLVHTPSVLGSRPPRSAIAVFALLTALFASIFWIDMERFDVNHRLKNADMPTIARALTWAPPSHAVWYYFGRRARRVDRKAASFFVEECASQAAVYDPNSYRLWLVVGKMRLRLKDYPGARAAFKRVNELRYWVKTPPVPENK